MRTLQIFKIMTAAVLALGIASISRADEASDSSSQSNSQRPPLPPGWTTADASCVKNILGTPGQNPPPSSDLVAQAEETCGVQLPPPPPEGGQGPRGPASESAPAEQQ